MKPAVGMNEPIKTEMGRKKDGIALPLFHGPSENGEYKIVPDQAEFHPDPPLLMPSTR